jgi:hypothetical protein
MLRAGTACLVLLAAGIPAIMLIRGQHAASSGDPVPPQLQARTTDSPPGIMPTAFALLQLNPDFDENRLILPAPHSPPYPVAAAHDQPHLRPISAWDREIVESLFRH